MSDSGDPRGYAHRRNKRRAVLTSGMSAPSDLGPRRPPNRAHGVGSQTARCYCPCGGKLKQGKCVRGCS